MSDDEDGFETNSGGVVANARQLFSLPAPPPNQGPPSISLAYLIDFAVQRTFQDLTVLAELLPKKSDMERKISIVQFAHSTRQLFIRLLAVVKWAKSAGKVDLCTGISYFLDQQAAMFVDTADRLFQLSKEFLPHARLPAFQIPAAVDVLVLGSYPRLPTCIKTRFVPDDSISLKEQACVLRRLNQVIQHRLIFATVPLPGKMQEFAIRNGIVTFTIPGEFQASLTLLGEDPGMPWSLLNIKILVQDYEIGEGQVLVHPFQVHYLHELVEARMLSSENPIAELYDVLHAFCVYLHLDILFCQASKFVHDRMIEFVSVDEYAQGHKLTISYWKSASKRPLTLGGGPAYSAQQHTSLPGFNYKLTIHVDVNEKRKALRVMHIPNADVRLPSLDDYSGTLNFENLLCDTIIIRIRNRLVQLKQRLDGSIATNSYISGKVPTLSIVLLEPQTETETLNVAINLFTGHFVCSLDLLGRIRVLEEIERFLNLAVWNKVKDKLLDLKMALLMERCRKTVVSLPVTIADSVPLLPSSTIFRTLSPNRLLLRFYRHEAFYLVVEIFSEDKRDCKMRFYLLSTCSANALTSAMPTEKSREISGICEFIKPVNLLLLDPNGGNDAVPTKVAKKESYFVPKLTTVVTNCDQRIPFALLYEEFDRKGIKYQLIREETGVDCLVFNILGFAKVPNNVDKRLFDALWSDSIVSLSGRLLHDRNRLHWTFELITCNIPLFGVHQRYNHDKDEDEGHTRVTVLNTPVASDGAAKCAEELINVMAAFAQFYDLVIRFAPSFKKSLHKLCEVINLSANRLVLSYGPRDKAFFVMLQWKQQESSFHLSFGTHLVAQKSLDSDEQQRVGRKISENPHSLLGSFIQTSFNEKRDLAYLMQYLSDTIDPLLALQQLPQLPSFGVGECQMQPVGYGHVFSILPISTTALRILYKWYACIEVNLVANGEVVLRDCGAHFSGQQTAARSAARFSPILGFKAFFALHEQLVGTSIVNAPVVEAPSGETLAGDEDPIQQAPQETFDNEATRSPLKKPESVNTASPAQPFPTPSPAMIAPSPLSASTSMLTAGVSAQQQGPPSQGPMTPSPAPATNFAGLLTPSPAAPLSNAGMLMTPSPAPFGSLQSPAPTAVQSVGSNSSAAANNNAPQLSPTGPEPSPLSFMKSFASEASAATGAETKGNGNDFGNWGDFCGMTPVTTAPPLAIENLPIAVAVAPTSLQPIATVSSVESFDGDASTANTEDWIPCVDPIIISHAALRSACAAGTDGRHPLKEFLASVSTFDKATKQLNFVSSS